MRDELDLKRWQGELREVERQFDRLYRQAWASGEFPELSEILFEAACRMYVLTLYDQPSILLGLLWRIEHALRMDRAKWREMKRAIVAGEDR